MATIAMEGGTALDLDEQGEEEELASSVCATEDAATADDVIPDDTEPEETEEGGPTRKSGKKSLKQQPMPRRRRRSDKRKEGFEFQPPTEMPRREYPPIWTTEACQRLDACFRLAKEQHVFMVGPEELNRLGLPAVYDNSLETRKSDGYLSLDSLGQTIAALKRYYRLLDIDIETWDVLPVIVFPFSAYQPEERPKPMTWENVGQKLEACKRINAFMLESISLLAIYEASTRKLKGATERLPSYELRAMSLLLAHKLDFRREGEIRELVRFQERPVGLSFDGETVKPIPASEATHWAP